MKPNQPARYVAKIHDGKQGVFDTARNRHSPFDKASNAEMAARFCNETPAFAAKLDWDYLPAPRQIQWKVTGCRPCGAFNLPEQKILSTAWGENEDQAFENFSLTQKIAAKQTGQTDTPWQRHQLKFTPVV